MYRFHSVRKMFDHGSIGGLAAPVAVAAHRCRCECAPHETIALRIPNWKQQPTYAFRFAMAVIERHGGTNILHTHTLRYSSKLYGNDRHKHHVRIMCVALSLSAVCCCFTLLSKMVPCKTPRNGRTIVNRLRIRTSPHTLDGRWLCQKSNTSCSCSWM